MPNDIAEYDVVTVIQTGRGKMRMPIGWSSDSRYPQMVLKCSILKQINRVGS